MFLSNLLPKSFLSNLRLLSLLSKLNKRSHQVIIYFLSFKSLRSNIVFAPPGPEIEPPPSAGSNWAEEADIPPLSVSWSIILFNEVLSFLNLLLKYCRRGVANTRTLFPLFSRNLTRGNHLISISNFKFFYKEIGNHFCLKIGFSEQLFSMIDISHFRSVGTKFISQYNQSLLKYLNTRIDFNIYNVVEVL